MISHCDDDDDDYDDELSDRRVALNDLVWENFKKDWGSKNPDKKWWEGLEEVDREIEAEEQRKYGHLLQQKQQPQQEQKKNNNNNNDDEKATTSSC